MAFVGLQTMRHHVQPKKKHDSNDIGFISKQRTRSAITTDSIVSLNMKQQHKNEQTLEKNNKNDDTLPVVQRINNWLHVSPQSTIVEGAYWSFILLFIAPFLGVVTFIKDVLYESVIHISSTDESNRKDVTNGDDPKNNNNSKTINKQLGVVITGCDSGFGQLLAMELSKLDGYVIFATCLTQQGTEQYSNMEKVYPIQMDVTNQESIDSAVSVVRAWLSDNNEKDNSDEATTTTTIPKNQSNNNKYLHAIVNNAGLGFPSLIDWQDVSRFEKTMDVNFFGVIRVTKAFLPIFKNQSAGVDVGTDSSAVPLPPHCGRIINMSSIAGKAAPAAAASYAASKYALEAFTKSLKEELQDFKIGVVAINPSFHETQMTDTMIDQMTREWERTSPTIREDYGDAYFQEVRDKWQSQQELVLWDPMNVVKTVITNLDESQTKVQDLPLNVYIGTDARFLIYPLSLVPTEVSNGIFQTIQKLFDSGNNDGDNNGSGIKPNLMVR